MVGLKRKQGEEINEGSGADPAPSKPRAPWTARPANEGLGSDSERGPGPLDPHLVDLTCTVTSGPQADHAKGSREAQGTEEDVLMIIIFAELSENIKAKFGICCNERVHCGSDDSLKQTNRTRERK